MVKNRGYFKRYFKGLFAFFLLALFVVLFVNLVSADFAVGNKSHSIETRYGQSETVKGWVNISLINEPINSLFQDSRNNSITLIDLLKKNSSYVYSCSPTNCSTGYASASGEVSKTFNLSIGQSKTLGLRFTGDVTQVNSINFNLNSDALESCENQITIDILSNGEVDVVNNKVGSASCSSLRTYGCYNSNIEKEENLISETPYCQRINLSNSQGFKIGAFVKKNSGSRTLEAVIYEDNSRVANCVLSNASGNFEEVSCDVNYSVISPRRFYVCVNSVSGVGDYRIRGNPSPVQGCGFFGNPIPSSTPGAYEIFAEGKGFAPVGNLQIQNSLPSGINFGSLVYNYILSKYGNLNCNPECVVPIKFTSGANQRITITELSMSYQKTTGLVSENRFYELSETPARISSGFKPIYLNDGSFSVPEAVGSYNFSLKLGSRNVVSQEVNVTDIPRIVSLNPTTTASVYPTDFIASVNSAAGIKKYFWDFGDNKTQITTTNSTRYTYNATGNYKITLTVTDTRNLSSSKTFNISVRSPKNLINTTIIKTKDNLDRINTQMANFDVFSQESIDSVLRIENTTQEIATLETRFNSAQSDAEYNQIVTRLLKLPVFPKSISETKTATSITFSPERESINLEVIKNAAGGDYDSNNQDSYVDAVISWNQENIDSKVTFKEFIGSYDGDLRSIVKVFELEVANKGTGDSYFLIMPKLEGLGFERGVLVREDQGYVYVDITNMERISFYTTDAVDFTNLPAFISPGINRLSLTNTGESIPGEEKPKWVIFILVIIFLVIAAFIVYVILQEWYRKRYENYLFKNRNDLYNMANYIHNSKKKGLSNKDISENLKKAKWGSEQVNYAMKKYAGERTGMFEIPITSLFKKNPKTYGTGNVKGL
ncbi:PKD domain-containing protein [Candidatus Pacearchaeota archaeon]|nr:PKD domain-containing protein [Candidatus Pacearchaeota archaeon]